MRSHRRLALFAADYVGFSVCEQLLQLHREIPILVVLDDENAPYQKRIRTLFSEQATRVFSFSQLLTPEGLHAFASCEVDIGLLVWWPVIIKPSLLSAVGQGFLNCHPSLLPHNRGKHYNFWNLVEDVPFGVSLHWVTPGIDDGPIAFQARLTKTWEDTGETLFRRAREAMIKLVISSFERILYGDIPAIPQEPGCGSFHYARELNSASQIDLDRTYTGRELLNLLRARTFPPHPGCWFMDEDATFEIRVSINRVPHVDANRE